LHADEALILIAEPTFERPPVQQAIPGAQQTVLAAKKWTDGELAPLTEAEFQSFDGGMEALLKITATSGAAILKAADVGIARDEASVITHVLITSEDDRLTASVLAPEIVKRFEDVLGPEFYVAMPHRNQLLLFPKAGADMRVLGAAVLESYAAALHPVSKEVFALNADGIRVVGSFEQESVDPSILYE